MYKPDFSSEAKASLALLDKEIAQRVLDKLKCCIKKTYIKVVIPAVLKRESGIQRRGVSLCWMRLKTKNFFFISSEFCGYE